MEKTVRIFVACAVGAFIGSIISLQAGNVAWPLGALVGAFLAYLGYNTEEVIAAIPVAYRRVAGWRPDGQYWKHWRGGFRYGFNTGSTVVIGFGIFGALCYWYSGSHSAEDYSVFLTIEGVLAIFSVGFSLFFGLLLGGAAGSGLVSARERSPQSVDDYLTMTFPNAFRVYLWLLPRGVIIGSWWLISNAPQGILIGLKFIVASFVFVKKFVMAFFRLVHSELRLLCAVDAALGAAIGYIAGNALIGAVAGGVLGAVNYEIITVRVMKLAGAKSMFR